MEARDTRHVILSLDYEIFGNGTGDVRRHVVEPAARMASLAEAHGAALTVFFEVEEFLAFQRHAAELRDTLGYDPAQLIAEQLQALAAAGHDVQLHLHPQWYGARYTAGEWLLDHDKHAVDSLFEDQQAVNTYIAERKAVVEKLARRGKAGHRVVAYRAGGFCAQPGERLLAALAHNGIRIDSSVVKGLCRREGGATLDYRDAPPGRMLWPVREDVATEDQAGRVFEIPIHSFMSRRIMQASFRRLRAKFSRHVPREKQKAMVRELGMGSNPMQFLRFLVRRIPVKLDFHNVSPRALVLWIRSAPRKDPADPVDALVMIGHTKEHIDDRSFGLLMQALAQARDLKVVTLAQLETELPRL